MDIYFCDECGARVTDLDLRGGKGMRQRQDVICSQCVGRGLAAEWLAKAGRTVGAAVGAPAAASDPISLARDRAVTSRDDPFDDDVVEPAPLKPSHGHETDALPAKPPRHEDDGFSAAAGAMGALAADLPKRDGDPRDGSEDDLTDHAGDEDPLAATSPTAMPGDVAAAAAAAKDETAATKPGKGGSSRQAAVKKGGTTSRRNASSKTTTKTSRQAKPSVMASKKVLVLSLVSCAAIAGIFFGLVVPNINGSKHKGPEVIRSDLLVNFGQIVKEVDGVTKEAMRNANDLAAQRKGIEALNQLNSEYAKFEKEATKLGWGEDGFSQQLENMGFADIKMRRQPISQRIFILEQQGSK